MFESEDVDLRKSISSRYAPPSRAYYDRPPTSRRDYQDPRDFERWYSLFLKEWIGKFLGMTDALLIAAERGVGALAHLQHPGGYLVHLLLRGEPTEGIIDTKF